MKFYFETEELEKKKVSNEMYSLLCPTKEPLG
jgi:hypothetical protein